MSSPIFVDEPLIIPLTPGEALWRSTQVLGVLRGLAGEAALTSPAAKLSSARSTLQSAVEDGEPVAAATALREIQKALSDLFAAASDNENYLKAFNFPTPALLDDLATIERVDISTLTVTFSVQGKQVLTSLAFARAANAKSYWLHEVRHFTDAPEERVEDAIVESLEPVFSRVRVPSGEHTFRIKSRNPSAWVLSDEFTIQIPELQATSH